MVSLRRNQFIALVVGVCVLSAAIGSGLALIAQTGPAGPRGAKGPPGPRGPQGESNSGQVEALEAELGELRSQLEEGESGDLESRLEELEAEISGFGGTASDLCKQLHLSC